MKKFTQKIVDNLKKLEITYGDVRVQKNYFNYISAEDNRIENSSLSENSGFGIRILYNGHWGFAASPVMNDREIEKIISIAYNMAFQASRIMGKGSVIFPHLEPIVGEFKTHFEIDPFIVSYDEKAGYLLNLNSKLLKNPKIKQARSSMLMEKITKTFASTEGSIFQTDYLMTYSEMQATAVENNDFKTRHYRINPRSMGYENIKYSDMESHVERVSNEALENIRAKNVSPGKKDIILDPQHLALTIHESVGHATELDRILGYEMSLAGESFVTVDMLHKFKYGSSLVNFMADNTLKGGLSTTGYDDEGVKCSSWDIIKEGILCGLSTNRETSGLLSKKSGGTCRADSWSSVPIVRIPNLLLMPGKERISIDDLISDTKDGIYIQDRGSFSIDQKRLNFQFGGDFFWEIKNGKITSPLKDVTYNAIGPEFWRSCDAICDERFWEPAGVINCGKGDPMQIAKMTHGASPARFRDVDVGIK